MLKLGVLNEKRCKKHFYIGFHALEGSKGGFAPFIRRLSSAICTSYPPQY
jgi:hypothetical protein